MDEIILLINNIFAYDVYLMQNALRDADGYRKELRTDKNYKNHSDQELTAIARERLAIHTPASIQALLSALSICTDATNNLKKYNRNPINEPVDSIPLNQLAKAELHQVMFGTKQYPIEYDFMMHEFSTAVYQYLQSNQAVGSKFTITMEQDNLLDVMTDNMASNTTQLSETLKRIASLHEMCDLSPFVLEEQVKYWLVNYEMSITTRLHEKIKLTPEQLEQLDKSILISQKDFASEIEDESQAEKSIMYAKAECRAHLEHIEVLLKQTPTDAIKHLLNEKKQLMEAALAVIALESPAKERMEILHEFLFKNAQKIAESSDDIGDRFMEAMSKIFRECKLPVPAIFITQGEKLLKNVIGLKNKSIFKGTPDDKEVAINDIKPNKGPSSSGNH